MKFTVDELPSINMKDFANWYDENASVAKAVAARMESDLRGFAEQSGSGRLAFHKVRVKDKQSFLDKILRIRKDHKSLRELRQQFHGDSIQPQQIIGDLIGARMVFYFEPDRELAYVYFHTYPTFRVEGIELYEMLPEDCPFLDESVHGLLKVLRSTGEDVNPIAKSSGYESMHLSLRYNPDFLNIRPRYKTPQQGFKEFQQFTIELQIRTIVQDAWAQVEHTLSYADRKRPHSQRRPANLGEHFLTQKMIAKAFERYQNTIWRRYWRLQRDRIPLKGTSFDLGRRLMEFDEQERNAIIQINERLDEFSRSGDKTLLRDVLDLFTELGKAHKVDYTKLHIPDKAEKWARQRVFLLLLGYLMTFGSKNTRTRIHTLLSVKLSAKPADPRMTAVAIYEHIRFLDDWFGSDTAPGRQTVKKLFHDALVHYRAAGAYFGEYGYYRRAIDVMSDALDEYRAHRSLSVSDDVVLKEAHLFRRQAEYYWAAFNLDGRTNEQDLIKAYETMWKAWRSTDLPGDKNHRIREQRKILSGLLTIAFFRFIHGSDTVLADARFQDETAGLETAVTQLLNHQDIQEKGHALQALAVWLWRGDQRDEAEKVLRRSQQIIERKARHHFYKGVVQEIISVMKRVENHGDQGDSVPAKTPQYTKKRPVAKTIPA